MVGFDDPFKADNLFIKNKWNDWLNVLENLFQVRQFLHLEYFFQFIIMGSSIETWKLEYNTEIVGHVKKREKIVKRVKDDSYKERRMTDQIETFRIINGISNYDRLFINISPQIGNLLSREISKT